jgi:hypothetical protein
MNARKTESRAYFRVLGKHITEVRKEIRMTQAELARAHKVSQRAGSPMRWATGAYPC